MASEDEYEEGVSSGCWHRLRLLLLCSVAAFPTVAVSLLRCQREGKREGFLVMMMRSEWVLDVRVRW